MLIRPDKDRFLSEENPFEAMMERFDHAAKLLDLDPGLYKVLRNPEKQIIVSNRNTNSKRCAYEVFHTFSNDLSIFFQLLPKGEEERVTP